MHFITWLFTAVSHYLSLFILRFYSKNKTVIFICGAPRSGTSWVSDVLAFYYNLPRPKHYLLPIMFESVIHTHAILNPRKFKSCFFVIRDGRDSYLSHYYKIRDSILSGKKIFGQKKYLKLFKDPSLSENTSTNVLELMKHDRKRKNSLIEKNNKILTYEKEFNVPVIRYEDARANPLENFSKAITKFSGTCDTERLARVLELLSKDSQRKLSPERRSTNINRSSTDWKNTLNQKTLNYYNSQLKT